MSLGLKTIGLSLIAALAMSGVEVSSALAETGGHFTTEIEHVELVGEGSKENPVTVHTFGQSLSCKSTSYTGTVNSKAKTVTELTLIPLTKECSAGGATMHVSMNGCHYVFTVRKNEPAKNHNTMHLSCPGGGPTLLITAPLGNCKFEVTPNQTPSGGIVYETGGTGNTHDLTLTFTLSGFHAVIVEGGFFQCGTSETTTTGCQTTGKATLKAINPANGQQVGITATGF